MPRSTGSKVIPWLLVGVIALIAYGSLYPFNFEAGAIRGGLLEAIRQLSWARAGRGDRISNVLLYLPLGFCAFLWLRGHLGRIPAILLATCLGALLSLTIEIAQGYLSARVPSLTDLALNSLGTALGAAGGIAWRLGMHWMHLPAREEPRRRDSTAGLLIVAWLLWRFAPFIPHTDLGKLKAALRPLFDPQIDPLMVFAYLTCWLIVSQALAAIVSRARLLEALLALIAVVLVGRLLVADQAFVPSELVALVLLLPLLVITDRLTSAPRKLLLLGSVLIVFASYRLAPFILADSASNFDFWPFLTWFQAGIGVTLRATDWTLLFGQIFMFAAVVWTLTYCGLPMTLAAVAMLVLAVLTEILQLWLPGQTGSLTDLALALIVAGAFRHVEQRSRRTNGFTLR